MEINCKTNFALNTNYGEYYEIKKISRDTNASRKRTYRTTQFLLRGTSNSFVTLIPDPFRNPSTAPLYQASLRRTKIEKATITLTIYPGTLNCKSDGTDQKERTRGAPAGFHRTLVSSGCTPRDNENTERFTHRETLINPCQQGERKSGCGRVSVPLLPPRGPIFPKYRADSRDITAEADWKRAIRSSEFRGERAARRCRDDSRPRIRKRGEVETAAAQVPRRNFNFRGSPRAYTS
ncbi:hypothetical protein K0M31_013933 [Melipona bicolor]|uniref:Uncharacterized protein n=1 Tax=Melipona bicolor TaxID=60889 RepID=A0AA40G7T1_9HYME|nr:hypothetical protein K0M31_013933 [Melipona bicolor]